MDLNTLEIVKESTLNLHSVLIPNNVNQNHAFAINTHMRIFK